MALLFVDFADEWFTFFPAGALSAIQADVGLSYAQGGAVLAGLTLGGVLGLALIVASDYVSRRLLASAGALVYGGCLLLFASAQRFEVLLLATLLWAAASDAFVHGSQVALVDLAEEDALVPLLARQHAFAYVGDLLGPLTLAAAALLGLDWRLVFALAGGLMVVYAGWLATQPLPRPHPPEQLANPFAGMLAVLRDRRVLLLGGAALLYGLLDEPLLGFTIAYLERVRQATAAEATAVALAIVGGGLAGSLTVERWAEWAGERRLVLIAPAALVAALALVVALPAVPLIALAGFSFGLCGAAFYAVLEAAYLGLRPGQAGSTEAVVSTIALAGAAFPPLAGRLADTYGLAAGLGSYLAVPAALLLLLWLGRALLPEERDEED